MTYEEALKQWPPPVGTRMRRAHPKGEPGRLAHVMAHVPTPDDGTHVVIRSWSRRRQCWCYEVERITAMMEGLWTREAEESAANGRGRE